MTASRITELGQPVDSRSAARRKAIVEIVYSLLFGALAAWLAVGAIEWISEIMGRG